MNHNPMSKQSWNRSVDAQALLMSLHTADYDLTDEGQRRLRLLACELVFRTPLPDGGRVWDALRHVQYREAVLMSESYAFGDVPAERLAAVRETVSSLISFSQMGLNGSELEAPASAQAAQAALATMHPDPMDAALEAVAYTRSASGNIEWINARQARILREVIDFPGDDDD